MIDELGRDPLVSSLADSLRIHPESCKLRVERKLEQIAFQAPQDGGEAKLISVKGGDVRLQVSVDGHACGSTAGDGTRRPWKRRYTKPRRT